MTDEQILTELRTIRTLLAFDKQEQLSDIQNNLSELQERLLDELSGDSWTSIPTSEIAEEEGVSGKTVQNHANKLREMNLIERRGDGRGIEYRKTGIMRAAELAGSNFE